MTKVAIYSFLLLVGLALSQVAPGLSDGTAAEVVRGATMTALAFIMIHVGYEFELDRGRPGRYAVDAAVAVAGAVVPAVLAAVYLKAAVQPALATREAMVLSLFAAPTSAGVLFAMLSAAGLGATWVFAKARVLAILDDLAVVLLILPMKVMMVGLRWELFAVAAVIVVLLVLAWRHLHEVRLPAAWPYVALYAVAITAACEGLHYTSDYLHLEVLLPAFTLGCVLAHPAGADPHVNDAERNVEQGPTSAAEQRVSTVVAAAFMLLVGLSMPPLGEQITWATVGHVAVLTVLVNAGKLVPLLTYGREATVRQRLALAVGLFPRGEVGAGVLVLSLAYGLAGPGLTVAVLTLAVNLVGTGAFIVVVKRLLAGDRPADAPPDLATLR